ncbi:hypothetical protein ACR6C2_18195 [Streptomyces sp. INA 01156]
MTPGVRSAAPGRAPGAHIGELHLQAAGAAAAVAEADLVQALGGGVAQLLTGAGAWALKRRVWSATSAPTTRKAPVPHR